MGESNNPKFYFPIWTIHVKFDKVSCGVSHAVLHGVTLHGDSVFVALGRSDMGQHPREENFANKGDQQRHFRLEALPSPSSLPITVAKATIIKTTTTTEAISETAEKVLPFREDWMTEIAHVWCGSEFVYACDYSGYLYSRDGEIIVIWDL